MVGITYEGRKEVLAELRKVREDYSSSYAYKNLCNALVVYLLTERDPVDMQAEVRHMRSLLRRLSV